MGTSLKHWPPASTSRTSIGPRTGEEPGERGCWRRRTSAIASSIRSAAAVRMAHPDEAVTIRRLAELDDAPRARRRDSGRDDRGGHRGGSVAGRRTSGGRPVRLHLRGGRSVARQRDGADRPPSSSLALRAVDAAAVYMKPPARRCARTAAGTSIAGRELRPSRRRTGGWLEFS